MTSQPGYPTVAMHILTNIARSKGDQAIKLGQQPLEFTSICDNC